MSLSRKPSFLPRMYCSRVKGLPAISFSKSDRFLSLDRNHLSIFVILYISSKDMPRFMAWYTTKILSSVISLSLSWISSSVSSSSLGMFMVLRDISAPRTAFIMAISKLVPIAITSPVAFILEPKLCFAYRNLSKGHLGSFTTT